MRTERVNEQTRKRSPLWRVNFWLAAIVIVSLIVATVGVVLPYLVLRQPEPGVTFETISDTNVLDVRRPLQDLSIVFRGEDVQEQNLNLRIVTINIVNSGEVDILPVHYDHEDDWGMKFKDGEVIEARLVDSSSDYLQSKVIPRRLGADAVLFPKVIFEKDAFFAIEVLLLHSKSESPSITSVGKIAGIDRITVITRPLSRQEVSFATELFQGSVLVQAVRTIIYVFGSLIALVVIIFLLFGTSEAISTISSRKRKKRIFQTQTINEMEQGEIQDLLVSHYEANGIEGLKGLQKLLKEPTRLQWITPQGWWTIQDFHQIGDWAATGRDLDIELMPFRPQFTVFDMVKAGVLKRGEDNKPVIDQAFGKAVDSLVLELDK